jgi:nitrogen-specific signal transduction histidine kinase
MHKPSKFGDNLTSSRYSVDYVNKNKKRIEGFEVGRIIHGFRFVYPMYTKDKEHLGSVEVSMSSEIFKKIIEKSYNSYVEFILNKDVIKQKLWEDQISDYYEESIFTQQYLKRKDKSKISLSLSKEDKKLISSFMNTNKAFSISVKKDDKTNGILTFLPIKNIKENKEVAYFIAYHDDKIISRLNLDFYIVVFVVVLLGLLVIFFVIKDEKYKNSLEEKISKKTKSLEEKTFELQKKYDEQKHILNTLTEAVLIYENDVCVECNDIALNMLGFNDISEILGKEFISFVDKEDRKVFPAECVNEDSLTTELMVIRNDGSKMPALLKYHGYCTSIKCMIIISIVDLSNLKEKEKQLMQQSKLAQMGEMISMIAHQWRQPLAAISSTTNALMLKSMMGKYEQDFFNDRLENISNYSQHLSSTIDDFRNFFKTHKENREIELETIIEDSLKIIQISVENNDIKVFKEFKNNKKLFTFPNELRQVVLNLLKNAEDALVEKEQDEKWIKIKTYEENGKNYLEVRDNAGGISQDIIDKIFEPYFSTKMEKNGTGLGLYMSKTIIEDHCKGKLSVSNDIDGAVFRIEL